MMTFAALLICMTSFWIGFITAAFVAGAKRGDQVSAPARLHRFPRVLRPRRKRVQDAILAYVEDIARLSALEVKVQHKRNMLWDWANRHGKSVDVRKILRGQTFDVVINPNSAVKHINLRPHDGAVPTGAISNAR